MDTLLWIGSEGESWQADMPPAWHVLKDVPESVLDDCEYLGLDLGRLVFIRWLVLHGRLTDDLAQAGRAAA